MKRHAQRVWGSACDLHSSVESAPVAPLLGGTCFVQRETHPAEREPGDHVRLLLRFRGKTEPRVEWRVQA
ncbi:hypothetical protein D623_10010746 [Myotis brandtii]|uniref:Uncharacterized protein n=1 Tax=Myotis brandtii TaxID=109478 RepID=S7PCC4_MYOBR|nr:hypothetical protein D623_10010746 [Myotis brandtii]